MGQVRLWNAPPKNPGYVLVLQQGLVNAEKASPHAKFYNLSTAHKGENIVGIQTDFAHSI